MTYHCGNIHCGCAISGSEILSGNAEERPDPTEEAEGQPSAESPIDLRDDLTPDAYLIASLAAALLEPPVGANLPPGEGPSETSSPTVVDAYWDGWWAKLFGDLLPAEFEDEPMRSAFVDGWHSGHLPRNSPLHPSWAASEPEPIPIKWCIRCRNTYPGGPEDSDFCPDCRLIPR